MFRIWQIFQRKTASLARDDHGAVLMITLSVFLLLFVLISGVYAVGETIHQKIQLQNAADAAAYSAAMVQADALSRMAVVNRAMSWTYVQMTKRQMDYITYRWLVLTEKHYREDRENAQRWHSFLPLVHVGTYYIPWVFNIMDNYHIPGVLGKLLKGFSIKNCESNHNRFGPGWWAGQDMNNCDVITINDHEISWAELRNIINTLSPQFDTMQITLTENSVGNTSAGNLAVQSTNASAGSGGGPTQEEKELEYAQQTGNAKPERSSFTSDADFEAALNNWEEGFYVWEDIHYPDPQQQQYQQEYIDAGHPKPKEDDYKDKTTGIMDETGYNAELARWKSDCDAWLEQKYGNTNGNNGNNTTKTGSSSGSYNGQPSKCRCDSNCPCPCERGKDLCSCACCMNVPTYSSSGYPPAEKWGDKLAELIDFDKENLQLLSAMHGIIIANAAESMKFAAQTALIRNLPVRKRDVDGNYITDDDKLNEFVYTIRTPVMLDPYSFVGAEDVDANIFTVLYNTEADERKFLSMGDSDATRRRLPEYFNIASNKTGGFDQWFIRGAEDDSRNGSRAAEGGEGAPGIRRVYKSANENETGEGLLLVGAVARGNHIIRLTANMDKNEFSSKLGSKLSGFSFNSSSSDDDPVGKWMNEQIMKRIVGDPNDPNNSGGLIGNLVSSVVDSLFKEANNLVDCTPSVGNDPDENDFMCKSVASSRALYSQYRWASAKWYCVFKPSLSFKHFKPRLKKRWESHVGIPKFYCGSGQCFQNGSLGKFLQPLLDFLPLPPLTEKQMTPSHGYGKTGWDPQNLMEPYLTMFRDKAFSREDYRCCAIGFDPLDNDSIFLHGHARIYGDDDEIYDSNRYVGPQVKPWILKENYFNGAGNIIVHVGRKHRNPFAAWWGEEGLTKFFSPPQSNYIWSVSAARAGVRRMRQGDTFFDYTMTYDGAFNNLAYDRQDPNTPENSGCVCNDSNKDAFARNWNLCEPEWGAVLIPVRYAGSKIENGEWKKPDPDKNPMSLEGVAIITLKGEVIHEVNNTSTTSFMPLTVAPGGSSDASTWDFDIKSLIDNKIY